MSLCDDKQTMPLPYLDSSIYWTKKKRKKRGKVHLHFRETLAGKNPRRTQRTAGCDARKCDIVPQIKVSPSKATHLFFFFFSLLLSVNNLSHAPLHHTHTSPAAIRCLSSMYPSNLYLPSRPRIPRSPSAYHRADRQRWGRNAPSAVEVCSSE